MPPFEDWSSERLRRTLENRVPESLHLDYKDKGSLLSKKRGEDISKDVSTFMNSDGGVLVYGVPEEKDQTGIPIPRRGDGQEIGLVRDEVSREQIEDLITGNISPKPEADLFQISEINYDQRSVFVVQVQAGIGGVWQAKDKRYYKRFHFKAEPMEHYEIEVIRNRSKGPDLKLALGFDSDWSKAIYSDTSQKNDYHIRIGVANYSDDVVETALFELWAYDSRIDPNRIYRIYGLKPSGQDRVKHEHPHITSPTPKHHKFQLHWNPSNDSLKGNYTPIFKLTDPMLIATFPFTVPCILFARVQAPRMSPKGYVISIKQNCFGDLCMKTFETIVEIA